MFYPKNKFKELTDQLFANPTCEYRGAPFWAWNCKLDSKLLGEQIDCFKKMGFGGFHMHSRTGMATPYLSEEFMEQVKFCVEKAKDKKMLAYLYDEDRWPSGSAGGLVTQNPRYRARYVECTVTPAEHYPFAVAQSQGKTLFLGAYDVILREDGTLKQYCRIEEDSPASGRKWYLYSKTCEESPWYNNQTYVDTLNKEAIDTFIHTTHDTYAAAVGEEFGKTIPSIFTDEPQFTFKKTLGFADSTDSAIFPWTLSFGESFQEVYGYDILDRFPELVWDLPDGGISTARYHFHNHIGDLFTQSFADNCGKWCEEHGIALTGHMMKEPTLESQTNALGEAMRSYRAFAIPGIDILCNHIEFSTAKQCQSAVHQYGREGMISELYGVTNWDFDFRGHKFQGDWQAALGVTIRVPHLAWASMAGEAKRDYPASISYQSPWHEEYPYIEDHFARLNTALTRGKPEVRVAVIHPVESYWIYYGPAENTFAIRTQLDQKFKNIIDWLLFGTIDFDFISESLLPAQIKEIDQKLRVGEMAYDVVVVPDCITLRKTTLDILTRFSDSGGKIVFAGTCPEYIDAVKTENVHSLYEKSICVPFDKIDILHALKEYRTIEIKNQNGAPCENLIYTMRQDIDCKWLFVARGKSPYEGTSMANPYEFTQPQKITLCITGEYYPALYDTLSGKIAQLPYVQKHGQTLISYDLYSGDSLLIKLSDSPIDAELFPSLSEKMPSKIIAMGDSLTVKRCEPNVLLLDQAEYALDGEAFHPKEEILKLDNTCRKRMGWPQRMDVFAQPWVVPDEPTAHTITLRFRIRSEISVPDVKLAIEDAEKLTITLNGTDVPAVADGWYVDKSIKTVPLPRLNKGENELLVKLPFGKRTGTEWCYLLGDFDVKVLGDSAVIIPPATDYAFSSLTHQGMPFYGGNVIYKEEIETPACDAVIRANYYRGALIRVFVDGKNQGVLAFSPYRLCIPNLSKGKHTVELVLFGTRINTFGGMHNVTRPAWVGPNYWRSEGTAWSYEYQLKDTGILASPVIELYE